MTSDAPFAAELETATLTDATANFSKQGEAIGKTKGRKPKTNSKEGDAHDAVAPRRNVRQKVNHMWHLQNLCQVGQVVPRSPDALRKLRKQLRSHYFFKYGIKTYNEKHIPK